MMPILRFIKRSCLFGLGLACASTLRGKFERRDMLEINHQ